MRATAIVCAWHEAAFIFDVLQGSTALHLAVYSCSQETAQLLIANGADVNAKGYNAQLRWCETYYEPDTVSLLVIQSPSWLDVALKHAGLFTLLACLDLTGTCKQCQHTEAAL